MGYGQGSHLPLLLACFQNMALNGTKKIKDVEMRGGILQDLHDVMYMSINHVETIDDFKERGRVDVRKNLHKHRPSDAWTNYL
jgi:hypothetical protein